MKNIVIFGFFFKKNVGDELFIQAFKKLFPQHNLKFVNKFMVKDIEKADAIFVGGGSLLNDPFVAEKGATELLNSKPLYYIGVGIEVIHPSHISIMKTANLIAVRSTNNIEAAKKINSNVILIPDLVYALSEDKRQGEKIKNSILVLPNIEVIGNNQDPQWKHSAWNYFKSEFSQFMDHLRKEINYEIHYGVMCDNYRQSDAAAAGELVSQMKHRNYHQILPRLPEDFGEVTELISSYEMIYTQRYHGAVLADICEVPFVSLAHHDKLKDVNGYVLPYYEASKARLFESFNDAKNIQNSIKLNNFDTLKSIINSQLG